MPRPARLRSAALSALSTAALLWASPASALQIPVATLLDADIADGACSLREAIVAANLDAPYRECPAGSGTDRITIALEGTILLGGDLPEITAPLEIFGPTSTALTLDGAGTYRPFLLAAGADVLRLRRMTLLEGHAADAGGCIAVPGGADELELRRMRFVGCSSDEDGGAVDGFAISMTTVLDSTFDGNVAGESGGAMNLWNFGAARVEDSTFSGNQAGGGGAIVASFVDLELVRSTVSGNSAEGSAGAISVGGFSTTSIVSSTIAGNLAGTSGSSGIGGGMTVGGSSVEITFVNSVVAGNDDLTVQGGIADDIYLGTAGGPPVLTSLGFNFIGSNDGSEDGFPAPPSPDLPNLNGDFVGTEAAPIDPRLGELAPHGGSTWTREPLADSPLLDQGGCAGDTADQRGFANQDTALRIVDQPALTNFGDGCDIGAVELGASDADGLLFADGLEIGTPGAWSAAVP